MLSLFDLTMIVIGLVIGMGFSGPHLILHELP